MTKKKLKYFLTRIFVVSLYSYSSFKRVNMSITSIMIPFIESQYTAEYIANVFWRQLIAQVGIITLLTYTKNNNVYSMAYITIDEWHDSENAYNFIQRLKNPNVEARIVHSEDYWWPVYINTHNNHHKFVGADTTIFNTFYFNSRRELYEDEDQDEDTEELTISTSSMTDICSKTNTVETQYSNSWDESYENLSQFSNQPYITQLQYRLSKAELWV